MSFSCIGLYEPKFDSNVGGVLRAAHVYGSSLVVVSGKRFKNEATDTTKAYRHVPLITKAQDLFDHLPSGCVPVAIEIIDGAVSLPNFIHPKNAFYIFGGEDRTLPQEIFDRCKHVVSIPTKFCMNLASTVNVVLYDRMAKSQKESKGNE